ncbi:MAG: hypothetical protein DRP56_07055 [Planctomycetota bacterium]|nr:MAG: hypothetical protein DRP56_07055 [Planctomycetota bacterium]
MTEYNKSKPAETESPRGGDDAIRNLALANQEINDIDHYWPLNGQVVDHADKGKHRYCQFVDTMLSGSFTDTTLAVTSGEDALMYKGTQNEVELVMSSDALQSGSSCLDGGILRNGKKMQFINTSGDALVDMVAIESYLASGDVTKDRVAMKDGLRVDGEVCLSGNLITDVADPISDQDAATKKFVAGQVEMTYTATATQKDAGSGWTDSGYEVELTPNKACKCLVTFVYSMENPTDWAGQNAQLSEATLGDSGSVAYHQGSNYNHVHQMAGQYLYTGLSAGTTYTFKLQIKGSGTRLDGSNPISIIAQAI